MRHRAARRHDAGHGRLRGLPAAEAEPADGANPGHHRHRARPAVRGRLKGLEAGADDFLTKPINELALITRVKSLVRLKALTDQLMLRASATSNFGIGDPLRRRHRLRRPRPHPAGRGQGLAPQPHRGGLGEAGHRVDVETEPQEALFRIAEGGYDLVIASLDLAEHDGLRLCSQIRSLERTRLLPILVIAQADETQRLVRGLDIGVNDYLMAPIDKNEMLARVRTQVRRNRFMERMRDTVHLTMEMAITDGPTGLHNRR